MMRIGRGVCGMGCFEGRSDKARIRDVAFSEKHASFALMKTQKMKRLCALSALVACCVCSPVSTAGLPEGVVEKLSSEQFEVRNKAYAELQKWVSKNGETAPEQLYQVWKGSSDPEVKSRCYVLMKESVVLRKFGKGMGFVGIMMDPVIVQGEKDPEKLGIKIVQVVSGTPAERDGLKVGDIILGIDDLDFNARIRKNPQTDVRGLFQEYVRDKQPGDEVEMKLMRGDKKVEKKLTLMKRPSSADETMLRQAQGGKAQQEQNYFEKWLQELEKKAQ